MKKLSVVVVFLIAVGFVGQLFYGSPVDYSMAIEDYTNVDERYATLLESPSLWAHAAMSSKDQIVALNRKKDVRQGTARSRIEYDPQMNAALVRMKKSGIGASSQLRVYWPNLNHENASKISLQWESRWDQGFTNTPGMSNLKAYQISDPDEDLMFELQTRMQPGSNVVAVPTIRYYRWNKYSEASDKDPMSSKGPQISRVNGKPIDNWQPGGDTAVDYRDKPSSADDHLNPEKWSPYLILPDLWYRISMEFQYEGQELRFCMWMQSEREENPVLVIASVESPGRCFLLSSDVTVHDLNFQNWWLEMNSSQTVSFDHEIKVWTKNFLVYKDASIPLE